jgi:hypothetical protein
MRNREPQRGRQGGTRNRSRRGHISASEKKRSGACRYSERKHACGGENSDANAHAGGRPCAGTAAAGLALEKKREPEHAAIAIRDARTGASTATRTHKRAGAHAPTLPPSQ